MRRLLSTALGLLGLLSGVAAQASLLETSTYNNHVYLVDDQSNQIRIYSLASETFLTPITLSQNPKAIHVDAAGIYVSYGTQIVKLALDGSNSTLVRNTSRTILDIEANDNYLFLGGSEYLQVVNKTNNTLVDSEQDNTWWSSAGNFTLAANGAFIYTTTGGRSPKDIYKLVVNTDGTIGGSGETPYHGDYSVGTQTNLFPTRNRIIDNSGNVYNTSNLTYVTNLGGAYTTADFWQGLPVILRNGRIYGYNLQLLESGNVALSGSATFNHLAIYNNKVFAFGLDNTQAIVVESLDVAQLNLSTPPAQIDPNGLAYKPDEIALGADQDTVYLLSKKHLSIFRWSVSQARYLDTITLTNSPEAFAYSAARGGIYLSYLDGDITYKDPTTDTETLFAHFAVPATAMVAAGDFLVTKHRDAGNWSTLKSWNRLGQKIGLHEWVSSSGDLFWDLGTKGVYYMSSSIGKLRFAPLNDDGTFGTAKMSSYYLGDNWADPIRISANGKFLATGTGLVLPDYDIKEFPEYNSNNAIDIYPSGNFTDIVWLHGNLFTIKGVDSNTYTKLERWNADFSRDTTADYEVEGAPLALVPLQQSGDLLFVYLQNGMPVFEIRPFTEVDFDGDGVLDSEDLFPADATETTDFDRDGAGDNSDQDDDNDGVEDINDAFPKNPAETLDTDKDGIGNNADTDDDGDGVSDLIDSFPFDPTESADLDHDGIGDNADTDKDGDHVPDNEDAFPRDRTETSDFDQDGIGDNADEDRDNDGIPNDKDHFPLNPAESNDADWDGIGDNADPDKDNDGIKNSDDVFPLDRNEWLDSDNDGIGNNSDTDDDNDGVPDWQDRFPLDARDSKDSDSDGIGDSQDPDRDGDGVNNNQDVFPDDRNEWLDTDKDGIGNTVDPDDDNDGVSDFLDYYPLDATKSALGDVARFLPMAKSNQWTYDVSGGTVTLGADKKIADQTINPITFPAGGKLYLKVVDNQIRFYGLYLPTVYTDFGSFSLDFNMDKGANLLSTSSNSGKGSVNISPTYGKRDLNWNTQVTYLGSESVVVPAGSYAALHTRIYFSGSATVDGVPVSIEYQSDFWFAEGVGLVKIVNQGAELNLTSSKITAEADGDTGGNTGGNTGGSTDSGKKGGGGGNTSLLLLALLGLCLPLRKKAS